ncbi:hypothetical protein [Aliagarivorans taiwanensis]|uniref:hypothetical protein n=1 Tax=Aliagarivorans taiwanensis TaxID=561966 RepID=UPI0003F8E086|nr:hypothetical protein [Aliagarivorans taiwanensis]
MKYLAFALLLPAFSGLASSTLVTSFEENDPSYTLAVDNKASQSIVEGIEYATDQDRAWKVSLGPAWSGGVKIYNDKGWDWRKYGSLYLDVVNPSNKRAHFQVRVLSNFAWEEDSAMSCSFELDPGTELDLQVVFGKASHCHHGKKFNRGRVMELQLWTERSAEVSLYVDNIRVGR